MNEAANETKIFWKLQQEIQEKLDVSWSTLERKIGKGMDSLKYVFFSLVEHFSNWPLNTIMYNFFYFPLEDLKRNVIEAEIPTLYTHTKMTAKGTGDFPPEVYDYIAKLRERVTGRKRGKMKSIRKFLFIFLEFLKQLFHIQDA